MKNVRKPKSDPIETTLQMCNDHDNVGSIKTSIC